MKKILLTGALLLSLIGFAAAQGKYMKLTDKDRTKDIMTLIQRITPYRTGISASGAQAIFFRYEMNSLNNPQGALIVIDGVKLTDDIENLKTVPVADIESIRVCVNAEDIALYTSLNVNGVVEIKTKRGN